MAASIQTAVVFLLILVGYAAGKAGLLDKAVTRGISGFVLSVALPFTIISVFDRSIPRDSLGSLGLMVLYAAGIHLLAVAAATVAFRRMPDRVRKVLSFAAVFSNCAFMGLPVIQGVFGKSGAMYSSVYIVVFNFFIWTYGVALFSGGGGKSSLAKALLNPGNVAVTVGLAVWFAPFELPEPVRLLVASMAGLTTPLSMVVVGATLAAVPLRGLLSGRALWIGVLARIIAMPAAVLGIMTVAGASGMGPAVCVVSAAMPVAAQTVIFAERYDGDVELASRMVLVTTALSALTIPVFAGLAGPFAGL